MRYPEQSASSSLFSQPKELAKNKNALLSQKRKGERTMTLYGLSPKGYWLAALLCPSFTRIQWERRNAIVLGNQ